MERISCWPPEDENPDDDETSNQANESQTSERLEKRLNSKRPAASLRWKEYDHSLKKLQRSAIVDEPLASIALARWWRSSGKKVVSPERLAKMTAGDNISPNVQLQRLTKLPEALHFMQNEIARLTRAAQLPSSSAGTHAALATFLEKTDKLDEAVEHIAKAVSLDPQDKEWKWLSHRITTKRNMKHAQREMSEKLGICDVTKELQKPSPVERRAASGLTVEEFQENYTMTSTPVIITGLDEGHITTIPWTLDHIKDVAGSLPVTVKRLVPDSLDWARLVDAETMTVSAFLSDLIRYNNEPLHDQRYLFDWSLPLHCPRLAEEISIPRYFSDNYLTQTEPGSLYHQSWPSLFIAPRGLRSELHVDAFGSNFWMALFQGKKRWVFFPREDLPLLYPRYESDQSTDPVFDVCLKKPDFSTHPLLSLAKPRECVLQPGEVLFVPAGCPHYVENLEQSLAISANFVDKSNISLVKSELEVNALLDERAEDLLDQLNMKFCIH